MLGQRAGTDETAAVAWAEHVPADEDAPALLSVCRERRNGSRARHQ